ncbi:MAG: hypothetical protein PXX77_10200 [Gallionella sp.]|nr:hypothetical protein [Gallionella sp.]
MNKPNANSYVLGPPGIISTKDLRPGDILLHYGKWWKIVPLLIRRYTGSPYTHASIYLGNGEIAEATPPRVRKSQVSKAIKSSKHIAVFRSQLGFGNDCTERLITFVNETLKNKARYDIPGAWKIRNNGPMLRHAETVHEKLMEFFETNPAPKDQAKDAFFCSAFVVACYCEAGIIDDSARIIFDPKIYSPKGLSEEATFGHVLGYIAKDGYSVPSCDPFLNRSSFREIFNCDYIA